MVSYVTIEIMNLTQESDVTCSRKDETTPEPAAFRDRITNGEGPRHSGRLSSIVVTAAPTIAFVVANAVSSLYPALLAAGLVALAAFSWRLRRQQSLKQAIIGLAIVAACAAVAAITGQARGFFLIPTLIPFAVIIVCVTTIAMRRPLTGLILNRVSGGPTDWRDNRRLLRVYVLSTLAAAAVNVVNATFQVIFYRANDPLVLGAAHIATGPIFAVLVATTVVFARRAINATRAQS
jgi:anti-sigma factor RsiW